MSSGVKRENPGDDAAAPPPAAGPPADAAAAKPKHNRSKVRFLPVNALPPVPVARAALSPLWCAG